MKQNIFRELAKESDTDVKARASLKISLKCQK